MCMHGQNPLRVCATSQPSHAQLITARVLFSTLITRQVGEQGLVSTAHEWLGEGEVHGAGATRECVPE